MAAARAAFYETVQRFKTITDGNNAGQKVAEPLRDVRVEVFVGGTTNLASIYASRPTNPADPNSGSAKANPFTTGDDGAVYFFANPGDYDVRFTDTVVPARIAQQTFAWSAVPGAATGILGSLLEDNAANARVVGPAAVDPGAMSFLPAKIAYLNNSLADATNVTFAASGGRCYVFWSRRGLAGGADQALGARMLVDGVAQTPDNVVDLVKAGQEGTFTVWAKDIGTKSGTVTLRTDQIGGQLHTLRRQCVWVVEVRES